MSTAAEAMQNLILLDGRLKARDPEITLYEKYYEGDHRLQFATTRFRSAFGSLFNAFADNWTELVVRTSSERLLVNGFRSGVGNAEDDVDATQIWKDNFLDADYRIAHTEAIKLGHAYILVDGENKAEGTNSPLITIKHPAHAIVRHDPANPRRRISGLHEWVDEISGRVMATLYMADTVYRYEADESQDKEDRPGLSTTGLQLGTDYQSSPAVGNVKWIQRKGVPFELPNKLGVVPLVPLRNNPTLKVGGRSDLAPVVPLQDACNKLLADMLIASEFASFPQRWATGLEIPKDPLTGRPLNTEQFMSSVARVWTAPDRESKFGQFQASDLKNYTNAIEMIIQHLAAITSTPPHYLLGSSGNFPSGDSLTATETGLVAKVKSKQTDFQTTWNEVMKLAFRALGDPRAGNDIQTVWGDAEQRIYSQKVDGALKLATLGVPQDALWESTGASPEQVARWKRLKEGMGQTANSTEFAEVPPPAEGEKPAPLGPEGNLPIEQAISTAERVARIAD